MVCQSECNFKIKYNIFFFYLSPLYCFLSTHSVCFAHSEITPCYFVIEVLYLFFGPAGSSLLWVFSGCDQQGPLLLWCLGTSLWKRLLLESMGSGLHGFHCSTWACSCDSWALEPCRSVAVAHGLVALQHVVSPWTRDWTVSPALAGGFLTTGPPEKPLFLSFICAMI